MTAIQVTDAGVNLLRDGAKGANNPKLLYVAIGSSSTAPTGGDTKLGNEVFRKLATSYTNGGSAGELLVDLYLTPSDAVGANIQEVGVFGGSTATSAANTGVLLARGLFVHNPKTSLESITLHLDLTLTHT